VERSIKEYIDMNMDVPSRLIRRKTALEADIEKLDDEQCAPSPNFKVSRGGVGSASSWKGNPPSDNEGEKESEQEGGEEEGEGEEEEEEGEGEDGEIWEE
jgi:hypothetical protein